MRYRGLLDALVKIPREEGLLALWKGLLPRLMRIPPGQARLCLSDAKRCVGRGDARSILGHGGAAVVAGVLPAWRSPSPLRYDAACR